jgi:sugar lactone lactonase YvrE
MASNARNLSKLLGTSTQVPTTALPPAIADLETVGQTLSGGEIAPSSIKSNTLTQSFDSNQAVEFNMADSIDAVSPIVSVFKEVPQQGFSSKGRWDVNANATNYEFFDEKPISYSSANLTPSATGDGTFTNSAANTSGFAVSAAAYDNVSFSASSQVLNGGGIAFKPDGLTMYLVNSNNDNTFQYTLTTAFDISTASYANKTYTHSETATGYSAGDIVFKPDGTKYWLIAANTSTGDRIFQYSMSTAWDISTSSYDSVSFATGISIPNGLAFKPDGTRLFMSGYSGATDKPIRQVDLSTAWDLSTATYNSVSFDTSPVLGQVSSTDSPTSLHLNSDGTKIFVSTKGSDKIYEYAMSTAYDLSTISYSNVEFSVTTEEQDLWAITFSNDGTKMYAFGYNDTVYQYSSAVSLAFYSADVGKKVVGNSGSAIITATSGTYQSVTAFADTSAISSWQLFGAEGKSDGSGIELSGYVSSFNISSSALSYTWNTSGFSQTLNNMSFKPDGTRVIIVDSALNNIVSYNLSTPWDLSTATAHYTKTGIQTNNRGIYFKSDGISVWTNNASEILSYTLSTAWDISSTWTNTFQTMNSTTLQNHTGHLKDIHFSSDGTKFYLCDFANRRVTEWDCSTAFRADTATYNNVLLDVYYNSSNIPMGMEFSSNGTVLLVISEQRNLLKYNLSTAWDLSTATYDSLKAVGSSGSASGLGIDTAGENFYVTIPNVSGDPVLQYYAAASNSTPYSQYMPALTNSSNGQINSSSWVDINSMTADETKNDGDVFYAVSTDNRTSWSVAKASDGVRKIARNNSGTWQYNNDAGTSTTVNLGFSLASPSYDNKSYSVSHSNPRGMYLKPDGTELYIGAYTGHVYQFTLSTANDISTASSTGNYNIDEENDTVALTFKPDGTKMYAASGTNVHQYTLSTAWDITTASYDSVSYTPSDVGSSDIHSLNFNSDGTKLFISDDGSSDRRIREYTLSTAYLLSSASTTSNYLYHAKANVRGVDFNSDGTKIFLSGVSDRKVYQYNLTSPYTLSSSQGTTADAEYNVISVISGGMYSMAFSNDGAKLFILETNTPSVKQFSTTESQNTIVYGTSETWVNGTTNNEHATLQQALTSQAFNRMNKAQLDAVADSYHFSQDSADTLDLMIAPYAASGTSPISDSVTINYDAEALIREAIPGTDYIAEFPNPNKLNITAVGAANLKIRAQ